MTRYNYRTVDVFTDRRFGGNPLAVFPDADGLDTATMQALAAEINYSETTFVLPPDDPANTARVRIFNRTSEMAFAGHPNVGTAFVLAMMGRINGGAARFEGLAGLVEVRGFGSPSARGAEIDAPQPLQLTGEFFAADIAACLALRPDQIQLRKHPPVRASVGIDFVLVAVDFECLGSATPNVNAYRRLVASRPDLRGRLSIFLYAETEDGIRARMFAPLSGTWEDPATGSANAALAALRLSIAGGDSLSYEAVQGVEMGRESRLSLKAHRSADGIRASVAGNCVGVFGGWIDL